MLKVGVLALQGAFREHIHHLLSIKGVDAIEIRTVEELRQVDGLILPGGESTAMMRLMEGTPLKEALKARIAEGLPVWGTCAGLILLAKEVDGQAGYLGQMDIVVKRNAYGSQQDSFSIQKVIPAIHNKPMACIFIRAPYIKSCGMTVEVLGTHKDHIIAARERNILVTSFHPELTTDACFHQFFVEGLKR